MYHEISNELERIRTSKRTLNWGYKMKYEHEEVERDYIEFRKEIGEDNNERVRTFLKKYNP